MKSILNGAIGLEGSTTIPFLKLMPTSPIPAGDQYSVFLPSGRVITNPLSHLSSSPSVVCHFGSIVKVEGNPAIRGGTLIAGGKVWNVSPNEINLSSDGEWVVWLSVGVEAMIEDDVLMPGLLTSDEPEWNLAPVDDGYPDMDLLAVNDPNGTAIIPLGILKVSEGNPKFTPTACGNITLDHCFRTITIQRT